ncbi:ATP-binding protein [uncultured Sphingomonas sp.]|uniref:sensor histidine kinase n=1 Tax=uncultured Sphingomonas sp. TaxID=158754 RepID=UPI00263990DA|nr:ATP-binding protein [uncultured Sphingomonas sp.]
MSSLAERRRVRSIAAPIVVLVLGAVMLTAVVLFAVTFNGPPPKDPPRGIASIAFALRTGRQPGDPGLPLRIYTADRAPIPMGPQHLDADAARRLSHALHVPQEDVVALIVRTPRGIPSAFVGGFAFGWRTPGGWRIVEGRPGPRFSNWHSRTLVAMSITVLLLSIPAWWIARVISGPLRRLANAADQARAGAAPPVFPAGGPAEVRALTTAVADMHDRLAHHAEQRTAMLAAIAHDMGTPLSRLAFWIEQLPDTARDRASADIDEMRAMISDTLGFARDEAGERDATLVELGSLLDSVVEDMSIGGAAVSLSPGPRAVVRGDPRALRRVFANLIGNAIRYGGTARLNWAVADAAATIHIEDDGPGIDPAQAERLFDPFVRGDPSRNRATGGTGLGLAIARAIVIRHEGHVSLANRECGGAIATVTLPLAR